MALSMLIINPYKKKVAKLMTYALKLILHC